MIGMDDETRRLLFAIINESGITDRHGLASEVLGYHVFSYTRLDDDDAWRIIRHLRGMLARGELVGRTWMQTRPVSLPTCCGVRQPLGQCAYCGGQVC